MIPTMLYCFLFFKCRALAKRLTIAEKARETLSEEIKVANQKISHLQVKKTTKNGIGTGVSF